ncbi:diaminopimelate dehydrogenase [Thorsellia anophelis]|uniref:Meso-diaminopimelate D-dehydrogenase n=1 Tax=Thorsellia anophelis DSM 18579 TaxID=1123402 RepID=A0A1I0A082_9GAMM|nr:diaminopimelate dehydrogenase [Thorsellia anophelis]SES87075.1 diaminopimelate dehydrogenase [Thorsellia anophelis DSM 18579]
MSSSTQIKSNEKCIRVAIIGLGNIGQFALEAIKQTDDMQCVGIVRRQLVTTEEQLTLGVPVVTEIEALGHVDVALLCVPSRSVEQQASFYLAKGINTVDSFDIHENILSLKSTLTPFANEHNSVAVIAAGWDPGTDSILRALMLTMAPKGITYTNFGPGMSMGHSVAAKAIEGVKDALSMTIPLGTGIHRRMVYIELDTHADESTVIAAIKADTYFSTSETHVKVVRSIAELKDMGHGVSMLHKGVSGQTHNQQFMFDMRINNPALTSQVMISAARASMKQKSGVYTLIEIPPVDFLAGNKEEWIKKLV